ncbi:alpha/beta hydrolase [Catenulispora subtropica]|uniref:Alpha/beta hydrolase family protein n=1 Tax=Catenulispora subtropica TaxID=450798 RepID=A0ABP5DNN2_9ACTN
MRTLVRKDVLPSHTIETWEWPSAALGVVKRADVLVPQTCLSAERKAAVLILLHGYGGSRSTWLTRTRLVEHLSGLDLVVVLPESGRRWFINDDRGLRYEDYLVRELVPFVDENYAVHLRHGLRAIGGFSMGGAGALMQALRHPGLFTVVASHAGAFEAPSRVGDPYAGLRDERDFMIPTEAAHERVWGPPGSAVRRLYDLPAMVDSGRASGLSVYADVGAQDYPRIVEMNRRMALKLRTAGFDLEFHERRGSHDLEYLDRALPFSLRYVDDKIRRL